MEQHFNKYISLLDKAYKDDLKANLGSILKEKFDDESEVEQLSQFIVSKLKLDTSKVEKPKGTVTKNTNIPSSSSAPTGNTCKFVITRGNNQGNLCGKKASHEDANGTPNMCCSSHKGKVCGVASGAPKVAAVTQRPHTNLAPSQQSSVKDILGQIDNEDEMDSQ